MNASHNVIGDRAQFANLVRLGLAVKRHHFRTHCVIAIRLVELIEQTQFLKRFRLIGINFSVLWNQAENNLLCLCAFLATKVCIPFASNALTTRSICSSLANFVNSLLGIKVLSV